MNEFVSFLVYGAFLGVILTGSCLLFGHTKDPKAPRIYRSRFCQVACGFIQGYLFIGFGWVFLLHQPGLWRLAECVVLVGIGMSMAVWAFEMLPTKRRLAMLR